VRKIFSVVILFIAILIQSCNLLTNSEDKPEAVERKTNFKIQLIDATGSMNKIYSSNFVSNAEVLIKSNSLGTEYIEYSDQYGMVYLNDVISDVYFISAVRRISPDEMTILTGQNTAFFKLVNRSHGTIELRADNDEVQTLQMDQIILDSPLLISEIYGCGPSGSGLYYHDKYLEVFNQSDSIVYLDGIIVARVYSSSYLGLNYIDDPENIHSKTVWIFPGAGTEYPIEPGEFKVCAEDAIDHRINAPESVDLSNVSFEYYKDDAPDLDNPAIPNMIKLYQSSGNDWLIGGERDALIIAQMNPDSIKWDGDQMLIPYKYVLDGVEYLKDPTQLEKKTLNPTIDAGGTGGIQFYTGKSMERILLSIEGKNRLKDNNNSTLDFRIHDHPSPEFHNEL
jgi:hypothetical protein